MNKKTNRNQQKKLKYMIPIGFFAIVAIAVFLFVQGIGVEKTEVTAKAVGELKILKSELTDQAKFYPYEVNGVKMEVLAFKASDNTIRTALNTCQICYDSGRGYYIQEGDKLICQNCSNQFAADQVELVKGGCNPVPIMKENKIEDETTITVSAKFLADNTELFKYWKQ